MITEDYVSFEIAKLLKEKGFDETCYACYEYFSSSITMYSGWPFEYKGEPVRNSKDIITCPTLQMAMKWLREVHKIYIDINIHIILEQWAGYNIDINKTNTKDCLLDKVISYKGSKYTSYEQACEAAIKYCLENLL